jgi:PKD repeat protein
VQFNASSSRAGTGRTISSYTWSFGDGATGSGVTVSHSYSVIGTYQVTLTVTDNVGLKNTVTNPVAVVNGVTAAFTFSDQPGSLTVIFNAEESRGSDSGFGTRNPITKYIWHFGDSENLEEKTSAITSHTFPAVGTFTVTLTVQDSAGRRQTTFTAVLVAN